LDNRGVVPDKDILNSQCWDFGNKDPAECICDRGVNTNEGKGAVERFTMVDHNLKVL
jgi:hypothetical protein